MVPLVVLSCCFYKVVIKLYIYCMYPKYLLVSLINVGVALYNHVYMNVWLYTLPSACVYVRICQVWTINFKLWVICTIY